MKDTISRALYPKPQEIAWTDGESFHLSRSCADQISSFTIGKSIPESIRLVKEDLSQPSRFSSYLLDITAEGIAVTCGDMRSFFCAVQTLAQIIVHAETDADGFIITSVHIEDYSLFEWRAFMLDISRDRVPTMETLHFLIDFLASLKYNQLQLYMEHTYAYEGHEAVHKSASPITESEFAALEIYCRERGMELVPNQNSFGHMERWLCHPAYHHLAEMPEGFTDMWGVFRPVSSTLSPAVEASSALITDLLSQLLADRESGYVNVGGDEPWELGQGKSKALCEQQGLARVYVDFLSRLHDIAASCGKRAMVWADVLMRHPEVVDSLPQDTILLDWGYEGNHPFEKECSLLSDSGYEYVLCTGTSSWNTIGGRWSNVQHNLNGAVQAGLRQKHRPRGFMVTEWGDNGHLQQQSIALPAIILAGGIAWRGEADLTPGLLGEILSHHLSLLTGKSDGAKPDPSLVKILSEVLMSLENLGEFYLEQDDTKEIHNSTLLGALLIDHLAPYYSDAIAQFAGYTFEKERKALFEASQILHKTFEYYREPLLVRDELIWTVNMLSFACSLGESRLTVRKRLCEYEDLKRSERDELSSMLAPLVDEYTRLWHLRSRPGGLEESVGRLHKLMERLH